MKFLCPSCKAKYQIADEKVAGRSVRMKCRKCGFVIPISEIPPAPATIAPGEGEAPEPSLVPRAPAAPVVTTPQVPKAPVSAARAEAKAPAPPSTPLKRPTLADVSIGPKPGGQAPGSRPLPPSGPGGPTVPGPQVKAPASAARPATKAPVPKSVGAVAPKPAGAQAPLGAKGVGLAAPGSKPDAAATPKPSVEVASKQEAAVTSSSTAVTKPLADAPARKFPDTAGPSPSPGSAPKAASSPQASSAPQLLSADENDDATHILKGGALADAFGALVGAAPAESASQLVGMPADEWYIGINDVPVGPVRLGEIRKRAMLGAVTPESMVWRDGLEAWRPLKTFPELLAVLEESVSSVRAAAAPLVRPDAAGALAKNDVDAFAASAVSTLTGPAVVTDDIALPGVARARSPVLVWIAMAVAAGFGVTIGFVFWGKKPEQVVKYVEVPAKPVDAPAAATAVDTHAADDTGAAAASAVAKARSGTPKVSGTKNSDADRGTGTGLTGLKGLSGLSPAGPGMTPSGPGASAPSGGGQLDAAQTQSTVARYTGSVKRSCWQPALDARDPSAPTSARVVVTMTVGATGSVQNVSTSGDPRGYPGLANCIGARVRAWQFPATGGTTTVNVPFVFAAQ